MQRNGFTLVELALVLVIIGLLVGGVLAGQDLIKASELRKTVRQIEKYDLATLAFRNKYMGLPGDLSSQKAVMLNLVPTTRGGSDGLGDGDGTIENGSGVLRHGLGNETMVFWSDLSQTGFIDEQIAVPASYMAATHASSAALLASRQVPSATLRNSIFFLVYPYQARNFYYLGGVGGVAAGGDTQLTNALSPYEGWSVDNKIDDGEGASGGIIAVSHLHDHSVAANNAGGLGDCLANAQGTYNLAEANRGNPNCRLSIRTQF